MSLPWRYSSLNDYVEGTLEQIRKEECSNLKIGKFYLHGLDIETEHMLTLFQHARESSKIKEITLCGVHIDEEAAEALQMLLKELEWKQVAFSQCTGKGIRSLSFPYLHIETIRIRQCQMDCEDFIALGYHIQNNTNLKELELFEEDFSEDENKSFRFGCSLAHSKSLRLLEMSYCRFDNKSITNLSKGLSGNLSLQSLYISAGELEDDQLTEIFQSMTKHPCLREVKFARNHCKTGGATALSKALSPSAICKLQSLDLSHQHIERANKVDISMLASTLATNATLTSLNLSFNKINDRDVELIATCLKGNQVLEELDLRVNKIGNVGSQAIAKYLLTQPCLKKLFMFGNPMGDEGAAALFKAITGNSILEILNMGYTSCYYDNIQFYTCLNRAGRRLLKQSINPALWPLVLERTAAVSKTSRGVCTDADLIFHLLHGSALMGA
jgi:hypothetical protein